jgi:hypothetical protein
VVIGLEEDHTLKVVCIFDFDFCVHLEKKCIVMINPFMGILDYISLGDFSFAFFFLQVFSLTLGRISFLRGTHILNLMLDSLVVEYMDLMGFCLLDCFPSLNLKLDLLIVYLLSETIAV